MEHACRWPVTLRYGVYISRQTKVAMSLMNRYKWQEGDQAGRIIVCEASNVTEPDW